MTISIPPENLDLTKVPDGLRVAGVPALLGAHGGIGNLPGTWTGTGFNLIWRPHQTGGDHFLQLNLTSESIEFNAIGGPVPNRGLGEPDIAIYAIRYLQQIRDANFPIPEGGGALHIEPGFWLSIPPNNESSELETLVRAASIPHGTTILAQGSAASQSPPQIPAVSTVPFNTLTQSPNPFPSESTLTTPSALRTNPLPENFPQSLVDDPNSFLTSANALAASKGFTFVEAIAIKVNATNGTTEGQEALSTISNISFLVPNADVGTVTATFWLERVTNPQGASFLQLQYSQTVMLNFNGLSWPHVTVGSLVKSV
jgi:hypothetical protein